MEGLEDAQRLVEVGVILPVELGCEPDARAIAATAAIRLPVRSRAVPREADHEAPVVAEVGGPEVLRCAQRGVDFCRDLLIELRGEGGQHCIRIVRGEAKVSLGCLLTKSEVAHRLHTHASTHA